MARTRVVRFDRHGGLDVLALHEEASTAPGRGEIRLRVAAFALNPSDSMIRAGKFFERPRLPSRVGYDAAGVIEAIGEGVHGWAVGDRVFTLPAFLQGVHGVQGSSVNVPARAVAKLPAAIDFEHGAALGVQYTTAYFALEEIAALRADDTLYVTAAAGNTGLAAIQVAHAAGARVIGVARDEASRSVMAARGVDVILDDGDDATLVARVADATKGEGVRVLYDGIGGPRTRLYGDLLGPSGIAILYGFLAGDALALAGIPLYRKGAQLRFYQVFHFTGTTETTASEAALDRARAFFARELDRGSLAPEVGAVFSLDDLSRAYAHAESSGTLGKTIVRTAGDLS